MLSSLLHDLTGTDDIQWMPPGQHTIHPSNDKGEVVERTVLVDEAAAEAVEELQPQSSGRSGRRPDG